MTMTNTALLFIIFGCSAIGMLATWAAIESGRTEPPEWVHIGVILLFTASIMVASVTGFSLLLEFVAPGTTAW